MMRVLAALACLTAVAHAEDSSEDRAAAARAANNPLPYTEQLKFNTMYSFAHGDTDYKAELQFEPVLPFHGLLIPGLDAGDVWSVARAQLTVESTQKSSGTASGFENLNFVDVAAERFGDLTVGAGFGTVFPMATSSELGPAKWQLGPAAAFNYAPVPAFSIAALGQALWSVAGSSEVSRQSYATLQPFLALHLGGGLHLESNATMNFYWVGGSTTIPVNLGLGYAFSKHFVGVIKGALTVAGANDGQWKAEVDLVFLP